MSTKQLYGAVAACAIVVYLGALWNRFALDDVPIVVLNPLVGQVSGLWRAFAAPYWPPALGGHMYRPLVIAGFGLDRLVNGSAWWFHAVNLLWHAGAAVAVAALARRWMDATGGLVAGLLFAVHPVHVEAVANVVGRAELMAGVFAVLTVYTALAARPVVWSAAAFALGLLSKENAAVAPALVVWAWMLGLNRPDRLRMIRLVAVWAVIGGVYAVVRTVVRHPFGGNMSIAPMYVGASPLALRLTAVSALADVVRLLVFPLTLRVDYSPNERTLVASLLDTRLAVGLGCLAVWAALVGFAWRRGRKLEAFGLGWIGIAFLPMANLLYPAGFYVAERTLYLPSVGLVLAVSATLMRLPQERLRPVVAALCVLGGARTALRVPVWRDDNSVTLSILEDSPASYGGPARMVGVYLERHEPDKALAATRIAAAVERFDPWIYATGSVAAFAAGKPATADSLLGALQRVCSGACAVGYYRYQAANAARYGYGDVADSLLARAARLEGP